MSLETQIRQFNGIDLLPFDAMVYYTPSPMDMVRSTFHFGAANKVIISHPLHDMHAHDTYKADRYGNVYNGHTTFQNPIKPSLPGKHIWHD